MNKTIHYYDAATGKYVRTYPSGRSASLSLGLNECYVSDYLKRCKQNINPKKWGPHNFTLEKHDIHPLFPSKISAPKIMTSMKNTIEDSGISESQLRAKHDMFFIIQSYVNNIPDGKYIEESVMLKILGLYGKPRYKDALNRHELKDHKGRVDGTTYYGSHTSIKKLKSEGVLQ